MSRLTCWTGKGSQFKRDNIAQLGFKWLSKTKQHTKVKFIAKQS